MEEDEYLVEDEDMKPMKIDQSAFDHEKQLEEEAEVFWMGKKII